jgi:hypothetical protein
MSRVQHLGLPSRLSTHVLICFLLCSLTIYVLTLHPEINHSFSNLIPRFEITLTVAAVDAAAVVNLAASKLLGSSHRHPT